MEKDQSTSRILDRERWEITLSNKDKFVVDGKEYELIMKASSVGGINLVKMKDFSINIAHIVSVVCIDRGVLKLNSGNKYKEITQEEKDRNLERLQKIREKVFNKNSDRKSKLI